MAINKTLERTVKLIPEDKYWGLKESFDLEYYLLESEIKGFDELEGKKAYGFEIVKKPTKGKSESCSVTNFSCCKESTSRVLNSLAESTVTPISLHFILDDILGE